LLLAAAVCGIGRAAAQPPPKMSQKDAQYQPTPRDGLSCVGCTFFRKPSSCQVVDGTIDAKGWCSLFDLPD
jgi:hypothetical protein